MDRLLTPRTTLLLVAALTLWRLYLAATLELHPDEAYYWLWSRQLDLGYFDHAPLVAYFIRLSTLAGDAELWVRLSGPLATLALSGLLWRLALQLYGSVPVAAASVQIFNAYPLSLLGLIVITPDVPALLFWGLAVWLLWQIVRTQRAALWYALGVVCGLALLSKYTTALLGPCVLLFLLVTEERRWLRTPHPYLAALLALLVFAPVLWWNSQHDWISFRFQLRHGLGEAANSLAQVGTYLAGQALLTGPLTWILGLYAALLGLTRRDKATLLLLCTSLPVIAVFAATSYRSLAGPNWPALAYFSFSLLLSTLLLQRPAPLHRALWGTALATSLLLSVGVTLHTRYGWATGLLSEPAREADASNEFHGWRELGAALAQEHHAGFVLVPSHQLAAELIYYTGGRLPVWTDPDARPSQFNLWPEPAALHAGDGLYVWSEGGAVGLYENYFVEVLDNHMLEVQRNGRLLRRYHLVQGRSSLLSGSAPPADR